MQLVAQQNYTIARSMKADIWSIEFIRAIIRLTVAFRFDMSRMKPLSGDL